MTFIQNLRDCAQISLVGGKAANLGALIRAGFCVPEGFAITTDAGEDAFETIREAYRRLAAPVVAVRSSATIEESPDVSMAGQFKTVLNVCSELELKDAIRACRASSQTAGTRAYLRAQGCMSRQVAMAVVVQRQIAADVAGVLFTSNPECPDEMLIEASRGLGEDLVSGRVQPDVFRVTADSGRIIESQLAASETCLTQAEAAALCAFGCAVAAHFGRAQDLEWAIADGEIFLLQARPITTSGSAGIRTDLIQTAKENLSQPGCGPWVLHNLAETVPQPTPLTWSTLRRFMSGFGGFGNMYKRLGFEPAPRDFLQLILGTVYMDLSRAPDLFGDNFPFAYDIELLRRDPSAAQLPPSIPRGSWRERLRARTQMSEAQRRIEIESLDLDRKLRQTIIPRFVAWCAKEKRRVLSALTNDEWIALWGERERNVMDKFAPEILFTNFVASSALARLRDCLAEHFWNDDPDALAQFLTSAGAPNRTLIADAELREVAQGKRPLATWLDEHGHRAIGEFDLTTQRWREIPEELTNYSQRLKDGCDPLELHQERARKAIGRMGELSAPAARQASERLDLARRYLIFREEGKHVLMLGYDLLRDMALDAARRLDVDVFWLTSDEVAKALSSGEVPKSEIDRRKVEHRALARIALPQLIAADSLATIGHVPKPVAGDCFNGRAISSGFASGEVRIVESPLEAANLGTGYVLVCPSTDPGWTPLFVNAAALVVECGGALSHGAIVARELNIPAVVLADATRLLREGERISVNGSEGIVARSTGELKPAASETLIPPEKKPPIPGARERRSAQIRNISIAFWSIYFLGAWVLPESWIYRPSLRVLDTLLWPLVAAFGKPAAVAMVGAGLALAASLVQAVFVDNFRLLEARRRSRVLRDEMATLAPDTVQHRAILPLLRSVHRRVIGAGLVPVGVLLGIFVMVFLWLAVRMDQDTPLPGSAARVIAIVDSDFHEPITISVKPPLRLDETSAPTRSLPRIRETLERWSSQQTLPASASADLRRYLRRGVPPQTLTWIVRSDTAGCFPVTLALKGKESVRQMVAFGDKLPAPDGQTIRDSSYPLRSVKVESTAPKRAFWNPGITSKVLNRDIGWPWIYLAGYLPVWLVLRRVMRLV